MLKKRRGTNFVYTNFIKITLKLSLFSALKEAVSVINAITDTWQMVHTYSICFAAILAQEKCSHLPQTVH